MVLIALTFIGRCGRFVFDVGTRWYRTGIGDMAAGVTFWILVSLPAAVLALLAVLGPIDRLAGGLGIQRRIEERVLDLVAQIFADESGNVRLAIEELFSQSNPGLFTASILLVLWSVSRGFAGLMRALEKIYEVTKPRPWYVTRLVALNLGLGSLLLTIPLVLADQYVWSALPGTFPQIVARSVFTLIVLTLWASTIYYFSAGVRNRWFHDLPGALVAAVLWWGLSVGFSRYVILAVDTNQVRAAVGAFLFALTWLWLVAQILLIGGAVNFLVAQRLGLPDKTADRDTGKTTKITARVGITTAELKELITPSLSRARSSRQRPKVKTCRR